VREFSFSKSHDGDQRNFHVPTGGSDSRQHPGNFLRMREGEDHLIDQLIFADRARHRSECSIGRHGGDKVARIERAQGFFPKASGQHGHVVHVGIFDHGG